MGKDNWIYTYYQGIKNGKYTVGKWIELIYEYIVHGFEDKRFYFDAKKAADAIEWIEDHCFHTEGPLAPGNITLEVWQKAFLSCIYGIVDAEGRRQFRDPPRSWTQERKDETCLGNRRLRISKFRIRFKGVLHSSET